MHGGAILCARRLLLPAAWLPAPYFAPSRMTSRQASPVGQYIRLGWSERLSKCSDNKDDTAIADSTEAASPSSAKPSSAVLQSPAAAIDTTASAGYDDGVDTQTGSGEPVATGDSAADQSAVTGGDSGWASPQRRLRSWSQNTQVLRPASVASSVHAGDAMAMHMFGSRPSTASSTFSVGSLGSFGAVRLN